MKSPCHQHLHIYQRHFIIMYHEVIQGLPGWLLSMLLSHFHTISPFVFKDWDLCAFIPYLPLFLRAETSVMVSLNLLAGSTYSNKSTTNFQKPQKQGTTTSTTKLTVHLYQTEEDTATKPTYQTDSSAATKSNLANWWQQIWLYIYLTTKRNIVIQFASF